MRVVRSSMSARIRSMRIRWYIGQPWYEPKQTE
jgi:hypothetical protein